MEQKKKYPFGVGITWSLKYRQKEVDSKFPENEILFT